MNKKISTVLLSVITILLCITSQKAVGHAAAKPEVMIRSYHLAEEMEFGEDTTLYVEVINMSNVYAVEGVLVTYTSNNNTVLPAVGTTNQVYIANLEPKETVEIGIPVVIMESNVDYAQASFSIEYTVESQAVYTNNSYIVFPFESNGKLNINNINVATDTNIGAKSLVGVNYSNDGRKDIKNVRLIISGVDEKPIEIPIGDLAAGRSSYYEHYVVYSSAGLNNVTVSMKYEDETGNSYETIGSSYSVVVAKAPVVEGEDTTLDTETEVANENEEEAQQISFPFLFFVIAVILFVVLIVLFIVQVIKNRKQ